MKTMKAKFLKVCLNKWQKMGSRVIPSAASCDCCRQWVLWPSKQEDKCIPSDVPKGHLVVYVGEDYTRYVINITLLNHPLFKALLDQAQEEYDFTAASKLCIPCDENIFLSVVRCAASPQDLRLLSMYFNPKRRNDNSTHFLSMLLASNPLSFSRLILSYVLPRTMNLIDRKGIRSILLGKIVSQMSRGGCETNVKLKFMKLEQMLLQFSQQGKVLAGSNPNNPYRKEKKILIKSYDVVVCEILEYDTITKSPATSQQNTNVKHHVMLKLKTGKVPCQGKEELHRNSCFSRYEQLYSAACLKLGAGPRGLVDWGLVVELRASSDLLGSPFEEALL
ncbi:hypothetical protein RHSIM_Rhsim04G0145000 [Rhododendron simsii]|uniref:SAUR-like auxin-responsive protein family n=1 Tax=Rhododendron simsii TaxID=118357 RepID=A0A834LTK1_RHOSS|nr:hypothetical protein RHSIM_Rhsim04G0145000 [Rhododendron simsii]